MERKEIQRLLQGPIATVPTPFDDEFKVDLGRLADLTRYWIDNGLVAGRAVIKVTAAIGEGYQLSDAEWPQVLRTVVQASNGQGAIVGAIHHKDTKRSIDDAKLAQDLGAFALQVSPPIYNDPVEADMLRYFEALSSSIDIGILVYNTHWLPSGNILPSTLAKMKDFEKVVGIKWNCPAGQDYEEIYALKNTFNIIENSGQPVRGHQLGARGYINITAPAYPAHDLKLWDLLEAGQYTEAQALWDNVSRRLIEWETKLTASSGGPGRATKAIMAAMGQPAGASRPPSLPHSQADLAELRELLLSFGWPVPSQADISVGAQ